MPMNMKTRNATKRIKASTDQRVMSLGLRRVAEGVRALRRLAEPQALDAEKKRDGAGDRNRQVGDPDRELREFGDGVLPGRLHQQHAPADHEQGDDAHADVGDPFHAQAVAVIQRIEQRADRDVRLGPVGGAAADEGEQHHQQDAGGLRPACRRVHPVAHEDAVRNDDRHDQHRYAGDGDAGDVQPLHRLPVDFSHRQKKGRVSGPFSGGLENHFVSRMRWSSPAYLAPYLSRTGWVALKNACLSAATNCTPLAFSSSVALAVFSSHSWRCSSCVSREYFLISAWSSLESLSQLTFENTNISGMMRCPVRL